MMDILSKIIVFSFVLCAVSCTKRDIPATQSSVLPEVSIVESSDIFTKGPVTGTSFSDNETYSLWICANGSHSEFNIKSTNIRSIKTADGWSYSHDDGAYEFSEIIIRKNGDLKIADFYAYAPFIKGNGSLTSIPFNMSKQYDLMYAVENATPTNKGKDITKDGDITATFRFRHSLSLVKFSIKTSQPGSTILLNQIWMKSASGSGTSTNIYTSGSFNAITGTVTGTLTGTLTAEQNIEISQNAKDAYLLVVPTDCGTNGIDVGFVMDGVGGSDGEYYSFNLSKEDLKHSDSSTYGFQKGYTYIVNCEIDNYVRIIDVSVKEGWTDQEMTEKEI